ncbi:MAG TPA: GTPase ObgE [Myxococcota bacterium]|nr:GTPase ObgE [Myxococcota bacterium]
MNFVDEVEIEVISGNGGAGCVSFRRERYVPKGGPDGGDGGRGGSVVLLANGQLTTLLDQRYTRNYKARNGRPGMGRDRYGAAAEDLIISVPAGTVVFDAKSGELLGDLDTDGALLTVAQGGRGGRGNIHFKSSTNRAPHKAELGESGESRGLRLELKLLADVGVVGFPNAGKSTLVARLSRARPKVADYPFTTLVPTLGVVELHDHQSFVMADVPGLIEGAHDGAGLGQRFLRHVERCKILVHLVTWEPGEAPTVDSLLERFESIEREMRLFNVALSEKPRLAAISKIDLGEVRELVEPVTRRLKERGLTVVPISAVSGEGLEQLLIEIEKLLAH